MVSEEKLSTSYKSAGVDIAAGEETVDKIKEIVKSTFNDNVLSGIGHFGAFYKVDFANYKEPVMVSSVDGVGTKLKVAFKMDIHNTVTVYHNRVCRCQESIPGKKNIQDSISI